MYAGNNITRNTFHSLLSYDINFSTALIYLCICTSMAFMAFTYTALQATKSAEESLLLTLDVALTPSSDRENFQAAIVELVRS
jgi:hypothetical protein